MTPSDLIAISAAVISVCALIISFLGYRRDRNKSNQDFIFQEKVAVYKELTFRANNILEDYYRLVDELQHFEGSEKEWVKFYEKEYDYYDKLVEKFHGSLFKSTPILPKKVYNEMWDFGQGAAHFLTSSFNGNADITIIAYDRLELSLMKNVNLIREDLKVEKLNINLSNRLK
jgi:hypothetical protein